MGIRRDRSPSPYDATEATVFCKLFSDMVSETLCLLRKKELDQRGCFSCDGCAMHGPFARQSRFPSESLYRGRARR